MRNRWSILALLCVLASLLVPGTVSAHSATGAENRLWAFDLAEQVHVGGAAPLTLNLHQGSESAQYDVASGSLLAAKAAKGGARVGGGITGYTKHGLEQAIGRDGGRGVHPKAILDAVRNPTKVIEQAGGTTKYIGKDATVILNGEGKVVTTWGRPRNPVPNK